MKVLSLLLCLVATPAGAYVRSRTSHNTPIFWPSSCVFVQPDSGGSPDLAPDVLAATIMQSMNDWIQPMMSCSTMQLMYDQPAPLEAHLDGKNIIKFRTDRWCHPNDAQNNNVCYEPANAAITTVFHLDHPGESDDGYILDADVELNAINFTFAILNADGTIPAGVTARPGTTIVDMENTLTHELGHLLGLDHTCKDAATPANEVDETGMPPPPCNAIPPAERTKIVDAVMYNFTMTGDVTKRTLKQDDLNGACAIYPSTNKYKCVRVNPSSYTHGGCALAGRSATGAGALGLLLGALALLRRRRYSGLHSN
jgi:hypothetical protein